MRLAALLLVGICTLAPATEVLGWDQMLANLRTGRAGPYAIYLGGRDNHLARRLTSGAIATAQIPIVVVPATERCMNPMNGDTVTGARLQDFFSATAGTVLFLDDSGLPIPQLSIPQAMHGDDTALFDLYFGYVGAGHYKTMAIGEYCRALGQEGVINRAVQRIKNGFAGREVAADEVLVTAVNHLTNEPIDPWKEPGVFHLYGSAANGRVLLAQVAEIQHAFGHLNPRITLIVPTGEEPDLRRLPDGVQCVLAHASKAAIEAAGPSPMMIFTAQAENARKGLVLYGFQPGDVLAKIIGLPLVDRSVLDRDIPYAEVDTEQGGAAPAGTVALSSPARPAPTAAGTAIMGARP